MMHKRLWFSRLAWAALVYTLLVVLWGAYVRATYSGAGCGGHWPLCNGDVVPRAPTAATLIEYTHRLSSGLALVLIAGLWVWSLRLFPRGHRGRVLARLALVFLVIEALLGAGLVIFEFVARNASAGRAVYLSAHLLNTQILLAMLASAAWAATRDTEWPGWKHTPAALRAALGAALAVSVTGAIAALGDTLFPASSLAAGIRQDVSSTAHAILRLRMLHPMAAVAGAAWLLWVTTNAAREAAGPGVRRAAKAAAWLTVLQLAAGVLNVALLAPVWMQLVHLLVADFVWIALVLLLLEQSETFAGRSKAPARGSAAM
jgi:heme a synthase